MIPITKKIWTVNKIFWALCYKFTPPFKRDPFLLLMLKWFFHIKFGRKISQNLIEECNCSFYHLSFLDLTKKPWWYIHITFVNASTHFYENSLFCCEVFSTNWCFLNFGMSHYCWKPFRYQELSSACEICPKKVQLKYLSVAECTFKVEANQRYIVWKRKKSLQKPWADY